MLASDLAFSPLGSGSGYAGSGAMNPTAMAINQQMGQRDILGGLLPTQSGSGAVGGMGGLGFNLDTGRLLLGGVNAIGNIWNGMKANKLAKEQFNFQKGITETNLVNQIKSYNTALEDRSRSRAAVEGQTPEQAAAYVEQNRLAR